MSLVAEAKWTIENRPDLAREIARQLKPISLTERQAELLAFIKIFRDRHGCTPTISEMRDGLKMSARSGIHRLVLGLEERGHIRRIPHRARCITLVEETKP